MSTSATTYGFDDVMVDPLRREVRRRGEVRPLQPQAFAVLEYLLRHRDRAVPKQELLDALWPDASVTDASLQRAISLARRAIGDRGTRLRSVPRFGYRFAGDVRTETGSPEPAVLVPRFVRSGDVHLACHVFGEGDVDVVIVPGWVFPMRGFFDHPQFAAWMRELAALGRVVLFDKRGTGLSDRVKTLPDLDQRMDDLRAVLDDVRSPGAVLVGLSEGGPLSVLHAVRYPERTRGLLLAGAFARWSAGPGYPHGWPRERFDALKRYIRQSWGAGQTIRAIVESHADDPDVAAWAARTEQAGASPGAALELLEMNQRIDIRPLLGAVAVPTVVLHHARDAVIPVECGRFLASHIPGARYIEADGRDHTFAFEGRQHVSEAVRSLLSFDGTHERADTGSPASPTSARQPRCSPGREIRDR